MTDYEIALAPITEAERKAFNELMVELRKLRRSDLFVPVARLQLLYTLNRIEQSEEYNETELNELRTLARGYAFNIASFTWPGWDDEETISTESQQLGLSAARIALAIAKQAKDVTFNALWINGAHELNAGNFEVALRFFQETHDTAHAESERCMALGWIALTQSLKSPSDETHSTLARTVQKIRDTDEENGEFFATQIETALEVYTRQN